MNEEKDIWGSTPDENAADGMSSDKTNEKGNKTMYMQEENKKSDSKMRLNTSIQKNEKNELKAGEKAGKAQEKLDKKREKSIKNADPAVKKRKKVIRRIIILVLIALVVGLFIFSKMQSANAGTPVTTVEATTGTVQQTLSTSGTVKSNTTKQYFAGVAVPITTVNVKVGDAVKKGDILFAYDEDQIENQIKIQQSTMSADAGSYSGSIYKNNQTLGNLSEANNNLPVINQQIDEVQSQIDTLNAQINEKTAKYTDEESEISKSIDGINNELSKWNMSTDNSDAMNEKKQESMDTVTQQQMKLEEIKSKQSNDKDIQAWKDQITVLQRSITELNGDKSTMESQQTTSKDGALDGGSLTNLSQSLEVKKLTAQQTLDSLTEVQGGVKADFNGIITDIKTVEGSTGAVGTEIMEEQSLDDVSVTMSVTKYDIDKIKKGEKATVNIAGKDYDGEITRINQMAVKNASGTPVINTEITITNPDNDVYLGVEAKITVACAKADNVVILPIECINTDKNGDFVYTVDNGILTRKAVELGISSDESVEVKSGVKAGDQVVTGVTADMVAGMKVTAMPQVDATSDAASDAGSTSAESQAESGSTAAAE